MKSDSVSLNELLLAIVKAEVSNRLTILALSEKVVLLQERLDVMSPIKELAIKKSADDLAKILDAELAMQAERTNSLLDSLEKYING